MSESSSGIESNIVIDDREKYNKGSVTCQEVLVIPEKEDEIIQSIAPPYYNLMKARKEYSEAQQEEFEERIRHNINWGMSLPKVEEPFLEFARPMTFMGVASEKAGETLFLLNEDGQDLVVKSVYMHSGKLPRHFTRNSSAYEFDIIEAEEATALIEKYKPDTGVGIDILFVGDHDPFYDDNGISPRETPPQSLIGRSSDEYSLLESRSRYFSGGDYTGFALTTRRGHALFYEGTFHTPENAEFISEDLQVIRIQRFDAIKELYGVDLEQG